MALSTMNAGLQLSHLSIAINEQAPIIHDVSLAIAPGTTHALMAPNGAGKSSLAYAIMGHPNYQITQGGMHFYGHDLAALSPDKRAKLGIFLAFQNPLTLPGVTVTSFLREAYQAIHNIHCTIAEFQQLLNIAMEKIGMESHFALRMVNDGFSGGEKKRLEVLQLLLLKPRLVILDEIDSGLDIDALKLIAKTICILKQENPAMIILIISHYERMLALMEPDFVHIMCRGRLVKSGDNTLVQLLERSGYQSFTTAEQ